MHPSLRADALRPSQPLPLPKGAAQKVALGTPPGRTKPNLGWEGSTDHSIDGGRSLTLRCRCEALLVSVSNASGQVLATVVASQCRTRGPLPPCRPMPPPLA